MSDNNQTNATNASWGGRFSEPVDAFVARYTASVEFDQRMYAQDIQGSVAHAKMLCKVGVLTEQERDDILRGLEEIRIEIERGEFPVVCRTGRRAHEHRSTPDTENRHHR